MVQEMLIYQIIQYDTRIQKKAVNNFLIDFGKDSRLTCFTNKDNQIAVGDNIGHISLFDLRNGNKPIKTFKNHLGSIKKLSYLDCSIEKLISSIINSQL